jgi:hypothetical protein
MVKMFEFATLIPPWVSLQLQIEFNIVVRTTSMTIMKDFIERQDYSTQHPCLKFQPRIFSRNIPNRIFKVSTITSAEVFQTSKSLMSLNRTRTIRCPFFPRKEYLFEKKKKCAQEIWTKDIAPRSTTVVFILSL